jgi:hypothetical protein
MCNKRREFCQKEINLYRALQQEAELIQNGELMGVRAVILGTTFIVSESSSDLSSDYS